MKAIVYFCDHVGCDAEEPIPARDKGPAPSGWGEIRVDVIARTPANPPMHPVDTFVKNGRHVTLCPKHVRDFLAVLQDPEDA